MSNCFTHEGHQKKKMEYKHFSHTHGLVVHQVPHESHVTCSGCKFPGTGSVYACWQCSFFLHEQCFQATRSMNHLSHPAHPLTLVPYPTYPSNSFFCNSCNSLGSGMSYSCSNCEVDLHVHCAYSMPITTTTHQSHPSNVTLNNPAPIYPPITANHESYPSNMTLNHHINPIEPNFQHNPITTYTPQNYNTLPTFTLQMGGMVPDQHQAVQQQHVPYLTGDQVPKNNLFYGESLHVNNHIPIDHSRQYDMNDTLVNQNQGGHQYYVPHSKGDHVPQSNLFPNEAMPVYTHIPVEDSRQYETLPNVNPQMSDHSVTKLPLVSDKLQASGGQSNPGEDQTQKKKTLNHFSHDHPLHLVEFKEDEYIVCSACEKDLSGSGYSCISSECEFNLHKSCIDLERQLKHESHPEHVLILLSSPPYKEQDEFTCNACCNTGSSFTYHCETCQFDLHVNCALLPKRAKREDHEHPLILLYSVPLAKPKEGEEDGSFSCDVCYSTMDESSWVYYCKKCDFGTHVECVGSKPKTLAESMIAAQNQMQLLNFQMNMSRQNAQFMAGLGKSMLSLV